MIVTKVEEGGVRSAREDGCVLFFSPEASVIPHYSAQCMLANFVREKGHKVLFVRCHSVYGHCPVMDMYLLPPGETQGNRAQVCDQCVKTSGAVLEAYKLDSVDLRDFLDADLVAEVARAMDAAPRNLLDFAYDDVPIGKMASLDFVLATKVSNFASLSEAMRRVWETYIRNSLLTYLLVQRLLDRIPVKALAHHEDYSILLSARMAAEKRGIPCTHVGFPQGSDRRRLFIMHRPGYGEDQRMMSQWDLWRGLALPPDMVREPMDDMLGRMGSQAGRVYSPKKTFEAADLHGRLGLDRGRKLLVAFTSSLDERLAGDCIIEGLRLRMVDASQPFKDQIEWLRALARFVGEIPGYQLVVRVHPREGGNKRESKVSDHLGMLREAFDRPLPNTHFVWPSDDVSSYDLAEIADVVLTAWTTLGLEMGRLAVPVLASTYGLGPRPNDDFHAWEPTPAAYFERLQDLARRPPALETVLHAFRWHMVLYRHHALDFSDLIPAKDFHGFPQIRMPREGEAAVEAILHKTDVLDLNRARLRALQIPGVTAVVERRETRIQLRRAVRFLFTGAEDGGDYDLILIETAEGPEAFRRRHGDAWPAGTAVVLASGDGGVHYLTASDTRSRTSRMLLRLSLLACQRGLLAGGFGMGAVLPPDAEALPSADRLAALLGDSAPAAGDEMREIIALRDAGRLADARARLARALEASGEDPALLNLQGTLESLGGDHAAAQATFTHICRRWPGFAKAHLNLALLSFNSGDRDGSLMHLADALERGSEDGDVVKGALRLLKASGLEEDAEAVLSRYARSNPREAEQIARLLRG